MLGSVLAVDSFASIYAEVDALLKLRPGLTLDFVLRCTPDELTDVFRTIKKHGPTRLL